MKLPSHHTSTPSSPTPMAALTYQRKCSPSELYAERTYVRDEQCERRERRTQAEAKLSTLSAKTRARFCNEVLVNLLDAGWYEGRVWDAVALNDFEDRFAAAYPGCVDETLLEFGGLTIGIDTRGLRVGILVEHEYFVPGVVELVVNTHLYVIGETDILCDGALGVMMDEAGHVYVNGPTWDDPPKDFCVGKASSGFDDFLNAMFSDSLGVLEKTAWMYYSRPHQTAKSGE